MNRKTITTEKLSSGVTVHLCKVVELDDILSDAEKEIFQDCEWNHFTYGDCDKSMLLRDRMIDELESSDENFDEAISRLRTLESDCFIAL